MKLDHIVIVLHVIVAHMVISSEEIPFQGEDNDIDFEPNMDYEVGLHSNRKPNTDYGVGMHSNRKPKGFQFSTLPRRASMRFTDDEMPDATTECETDIPDEETTQTEDELSTTTFSTEQQESSSLPPSTLFSTTWPTTETSTNRLINEEQEIKAKQLRNLVQHLYIAQARVQLEAAEIKKAQAVANTAQKALEEAANHVRSVTASLQSSQQEVATAAIRAQTAQLQLAAHDQLLFAARQDVDALSSQMVGLQAQEGISQPKITVDLSDLLEKLKRPLSEAEKPTPVPPIVQLPNPNHSKGMERYHKQQHIEPGFRDLYLE